MAAVSDSTVVQLFKNVYGDLTDLLPQDYPLARDIPFSQKMKVGAKYIEAIIVTNESGITISASSDAFELNSAVAGVVKQVEVEPFLTVLPSVVPWSTISRSAGGGERAFYDATKFIVKNNLTSHQKFQEIFRLYGRADQLLGYVSYATAYYRGVSFTQGTGTLNGITFTNGVNVAQKAILFAPGYFGAGIWTGLEGVNLCEVDSSGVIVAEGKLVSVNTAYGYITVDFVPTAASSVTSNRLCFKGMQDAQDYIGMDKILTTNGVLFGVDTQKYSLWKGNVYDCQNQQFTLPRLQEAIANMVNRSGMEGDMTVYLNPRSWATLCSTEAGLRVYDKSYDPKKGENGFDSLEFHAQTGRVRIFPHRMVMEGRAYGISVPTWSRSGSAEVGFSIPGMGQDVIFPTPNQAGYCFRSFSDQFLFCHKPAWNIAFIGINDESSV